MKPVRTPDAATNIHTTREAWLRAATNALWPYFDKLGYPLPSNIRFAIAFTSGGKRGLRRGECWHPASSADQHFEIIIRADIDDPLEVLSQLVPQLIHTLLPVEAKHGKQYRDIALRVGLEGPMRHARPTAMLTERLQAIAAALGPLPHARLEFATLSGTVKKSGAKYLKAECDKCGYTIRLIEKWARTGMPICPVDSEHGALVCDLPEEGADAPSLEDSDALTNILPD